MSTVKQHIKRPMNAFMIWSSRKRRELARQNPKLHNSQISKILGSEWRKLTEEEKQSFFAQAKLLSELHLIEHPDYKYRPKRRARKKHVKHKTENHTASSFNPCYCGECCSSPSQEPDQVIGQEDEIVHSPQLQGNDAEVFIKKEKNESLTASESIPANDLPTDPVMGRFSVHSRTLSPKCESRNFTSARSRSRLEIFEDSLRFRDDHLAMLRAEAMPSCYPSSFCTEPFQPPCHLLPSQFPRDRESPARFLPAYPSTRCSCCQSESMTSEEEFLASHGTPSFFPPSSQYLYGRRW